jgi:hypothetical protein
VKAVPNLGFLEVAKPCIQFLESAVTLLTAQSSVEIDVRCTSGVEDPPPKGKKAPAIDTGCKIIFIDQALEIAQWSV